MPRAERLFRLVLLGLVLVSCARNPVTGLLQPVLRSEAREVAATERRSLAIEANMGLVKQEVLTDYVSQLGQRLARQSPRALDYRFFVADSAVPNAFALPGGHIYVSRGLLVLLNSEDELAGVLGHEIAHVAARHSAAREVRSVALLPARIAGLLGGAAGSLILPRLGRSVADYVELPAALPLAAYDRKQEYEADRLGQEFAASEGWNPAALARVMDGLSAEQGLRGSDPNRISFLASHPASPDRARAILDHAAKLVAAPANRIATGPPEFLSRLEGLVVGESASDGVFLGSRFLHPEMHFVIDFPDGWELHNTRHSIVARNVPTGEYLVLSLDRGDDPLEAARLEAARRGLRDQPQALSIRGLPAAHFRTRSGSGRNELGLHFTWIGHGDRVYRVLGVSPRNRFGSVVSLFNSTSRSFRRMTRVDRDTVRESRLRYTEARRGELLRRLLARAGSVWSPEEAAVANGLEPDAVLGRGTWVKFPRREPYRYDLR